MNREFVEYLSQRTDETLAVATILHTVVLRLVKQVPRWLYSLMDLFFGTIGGGRSRK